MKYLGNCQTRAVFSYEPGDRVVITRGQISEGKPIAAAGETGIVLCQVSDKDPRLARQLYVEIKLDRNQETVIVLPTDVEPQEIKGFWK